MRILTLIATLVSFLLISHSNANAKIVEFENGGVSFVIPDNFHTLSVDEIKVKYPKTSRPKFVVATPTMATSIAYDLKSQRLKQSQLGSLKKYFEGVLPRMIPGLQWVKRDIIELAGQKWIYLELTSYAVDTDIHNIMLITSYKEKMLMFNFNSTKEKFASQEGALRKSMRSISIK